MSYEAWRREVAMGTMPDWDEEKNDYEWDPLNPPPENVPYYDSRQSLRSGKFPVVIPKELQKEDGDTKKDS